MAPDEDEVASPECFDLESLEAPEQGKDEDAGPSRDRESRSDSGHATLKYSLLGPSLTKAGQDSVDQSKVILKPVL